MYHEVPASPREAPLDALALEPLLCGLPGREGEVDAEFPVVLLGVVAVVVFLRLRVILVEVCGVFVLTSEKGLELPVGVAGCEDVLCAEFLEQVLQFFVVPLTFDAAILSAPMLGMNTGKYPKWLAKVTADFFCAIGKGTKYAAGQSGFSDKPSFETSSCVSRAVSYTHLTLPTNSRV